MNFPISGYEKRIVESVHENQVTIIVGETGSGKTTQIPQMLYRAGFAKSAMIGVTEPRRIAAISTAEFVASQLGVTVGGKVGYQVRFDDSSSEGTAIKFMTDGILLREFQVMQGLMKYSVIVVDEAHERSENIDFVLGLLKELLPKRDMLRVVVASATIDEQKFSKYFWDAPVINVSGRMFPVETVWANENVHEDDMVSWMAEQVLRIHTQKEPGDILAFMTGQDDISRTIDAIEELKMPGLVAVPIYGALSNEAQRDIFRDYRGKRKVIVATNIAETSLTIDGIKYVVDSGLIKQSNFHPEMGIQSLDVVEHSQSGCEQRKGRAGRTQSGICYRAYTKENFEARQKFTKPEILRTSLASVVLAMEDMEIKNIRDFDFIDSPEKSAFNEAYETLIALGAIEREKVGLTELGKAMAKLPLEPRISRMLLEAEKHGCVKNVATIAPFLEARNVFSRPRGKENEADIAHTKFKQSEFGDAMAYYSVWKGYEKSGLSDDWAYKNYLQPKSLREIVKIRTQLLKILDMNNIELSEKEDSVAMARAIAAGLAYNLFQHMSRGLYTGVLREGVSAKVHPGSALFRNQGVRWMVATDIRETSQVWAMGCTAVKPEWLPEIAPKVFKFGDSTLCEYSPEDGTATVKKTVLQGEFEVGNILEKVSIEEAIKVQDDCIKKAAKKGLVPLTFSERKDPRYTFIKDYYATWKGVLYKAFSGAKAGVTYYCKLEDFAGSKYARVEFPVFDLPVIRTAEKREEEIEAQDISPLQLGQLGERWGARVKVTNS